MSEKKQGRKRRGEFWEGEQKKKEIIQDLQKLQAKEQVELDDNTAAEPLESQFSAAVQHAMESCSKDSIAVRN